MLNVGKFMIVSVLLESSTLSPLMPAPPDALAPRPQLRAVVLEQLLDGGAVPPPRNQADGRAAPPGVDGVRGVVLVPVAVRLGEVLALLRYYAAMMMAQCLRIKISQP